MSTIASLNPGWILTPVSTASYSRDEKTARHSKEQRASKESWLNIMEFTLSEKILKNAKK